MMKTPFCESLRVVKHGTAPAPSLPANRERVRERVVERDVVTGQVRHRAPVLAATQASYWPPPSAWCVVSQSCEILGELQAQVARGGWNGSTPDWF
jgi:hypothetical protein